jgi:hypothetical protein
MLRARSGVGCASAILPSSRCNSESHKRSPDRSTKAKAYRNVLSASNGRRLSFSKIMTFSF